jgi:hypothetical protein
MPPSTAGQLDRGLAKVDDHVAEKGDSGDLIIEGLRSGPPRVKQDAKHDLPATACADSMCACQITA